jgi:hypothetical protein
MCDLNAFSCWSKSRDVWTLGLEQLRSRLKLAVKPLDSNAAAQLGCNSFRKKIRVQLVVFLYSYRLHKHNQVEYILTEQV